MGTKGKADNPHPATVEVKNEWSYNSAPPYAFKVYTGIILPLPYDVLRNVKWSRT
jgi:hypothetical protein